MASAAVGVDTELLGGTSPSAGEGKLLPDWASPLENGALRPQSLARKGFVPESCVLSWAGEEASGAVVTQKRDPTRMPRAWEAREASADQVPPRTHSLGHECLQQGSEGLGEVVLLHHVVQCHQGTVQVGNGLDLVFTL